MSQKVDCDRKEECFFWTCDPKYVHTCNFCIRNKAKTKEERGEDYSVKFEKDGY